VSQGVEHELRFLFAFVQSESRKCEWRFHSALQCGVTYANKRTYLRRSWLLHRRKQTLALKTLAIRHSTPWDETSTGLVPIAAGIIEADDSCANVRSHGGAHCVDRLCLQKAGIAEARSSVGEADGNTGRLSCRLSR